MIEVLKQALESLEDGDYWEKKETITSLRQAIAELESQEPVIDKSAATRIATSLGWSPQRTWVGLTDEEIWDAYMKAPVDIDCHVSDLHKFARAIEAKLKERNS
jgi:hypothetical protein